METANLLTTGTAMATPDDEPEQRSEKSGCDKGNNTAAGNLESAATTLRWLRLSVLLAAVFPWSCTVVPAADKPYPGLQSGIFQWTASPPLIGPAEESSDPCIAVKDPTVIRFADHWHVFCTVRFQSGRVGIEYLRFADWNSTARAFRQYLTLHEGYYAAPQVFYYRPHGLWYLVYQLADPQRTPAWGPYYSTTRDIADPASWTAPRPLVTSADKDQKWLDFWVICDSDKAHLFFTSLDGRMWRCETGLGDFPGSWSAPSVELEADIFEASQTYAVPQMNSYLTIVEAQGDSRRYYKAYVADTLDGQWEPLADTREKPFASRDNLQQAEPWTANVSHGELIRAGYDELLILDPTDLRMLFQGASDDQYRSNPYGMIPWRLGLLTAK